MQYDIDKIPFSRYGSYFAVIKDNRTDGLYIRDIHGRGETVSNLYELIVVDHLWEELKLERTETEISYYSKKQDGAYFSICLGKNDTLHLFVCGLTICIEPAENKYDALVPVSEGQYEHHLYKKQLKIRFTSVFGNSDIRQEWNGIGSQNIKLFYNMPDEQGFLGTASIVMESYRTVWEEKTYLSYEEVCEEAQREYEEWESNFLNPADRFEESRKLAVYTVCTNFVHQEGCLAYDAMYMSKKQMYSIGSWNNCFAGIVLSGTMPELAYEQFKIFMQHQDRSGIYPDYVNDTVVSFNCTKPPVYAWAFQKMMKQNNYFLQKEILQEAYDSFCRVTAFWFVHRTNPKAVFPVYYHGNDSGWNNASVFHKGFPVESPDLAAFLIYQMDALSDLAEKLEKPREAEVWKRKADEEFERFMKRFYYNGQFYAFYTPEEEQIKWGESLLTYLPIIIAYRMKKEITDELVSDMIEKFETPFGLATESPESEYYEKDGYWRGPIWAPATYLCIDALNESGYADIAKRLAEKFCRLTAIGLMAENYDPFSGRGFSDLSFACSSCVFLQLIKEFENLEEL